MKDAEFYQLAGLAFNYTCWFITRAGILVTVWILAKDLLK